MAGAIDAAEFLAVQQYTSHTIGIVSSMVASPARSAYDLVGCGVGALRSFLNGAASFAMNKCGQQRQLNSEVIPLCQK